MGSTGAMVVTSNNAIFKVSAFEHKYFWSKTDLCGYSRGCLKQFSMVPNGFAAKMGAGKGGLYFFSGFSLKCGLL